MIATRRAGPADLDLLIDWRRQLWPDDDTSRDALDESLRRDDFAAFLLLDGDAPVGFAEVTLRRYIDGAPDAANGFLEGIFVAASHRRAGAAGLLLAAAADWARANGATHLGSNSDDENSDSEAWHCATGFAEIGRTINFAKPL